MRRHGFLAVADALAHHQRSHQTSDTGVDVHHGAASVVKHAVAAEEAATPHHVSDRGVHGQQPDAHEPQQGRELHAVCKRSNDQRRGDDGEGHLEGHIGRLRNGRRQRVGRIQAHAAQEESAQSADEPIARRERQAVADDHPQHGHQTGDGEALHQRGEHVFLAHHAAIEQRQTGNGHHQHQRGGGQHPGVVAGVDEGGRIGGGSGRGGLRPGAAHAEQHRAERCGNCETFFHVGFLVEGVKGGSKGVAAGFTGADANDLFERRDEDLAVADLARACCGFDRFDGAFDQGFRHGRLDLHLGQKIDHVFRAAVQLGVALLPTETLDFGDGDARHPDARQGLAHLVQLERLDDGRDHFHVWLLQRARRPVGSERVNGHQLKRALLGGGGAVFFGEDRGVGLVLAHFGGQLDVFHRRVVHRQSQLLELVGGAGGAVARGDQAVLVIDVFATRRHAPFARQRVGGIQRQAVGLSCTDGAIGKR